MGILILVFLILLGGSYFGYQELKKRDFDIICEAYTAALEQKDSVDPAMLAYQTVEKINNSLITPPAKDAFSAILNAGPKHRYQLFLDSAKDIGYPSWECPAMDNSAE